MPFQFYKKYTVAEVKELLNEIAEKYPIGKVWVDHNPNNQGEKTCLYYYIDMRGDFSTWVQSQNNINKIDYRSGISWIDGTYKGTFTFVPVNEGVKPQLFEVGDLVEVCESARECGDFEDWNREKKDMIGKQYIIDKVKDDSYGIRYMISDFYLFPHYALKKVIEAPKPIKKSVTLELTDEQLQQIKQTYNL